MSHHEGAPDWATVSTHAFQWRIVAVLEAAQLTFVTEDDLQAEIQRALADAGIDARREIRLSDTTSRIDLLANSVGIEVKIAGSWASVVRQLTRYAKCDEITHLILVTSRAGHHRMPAQLCTKPLEVVSLLGAGL